MVEIINQGASIKIVTNGIARYVTKFQIKEIAIIKDEYVKLDIGQGLYNIFIRHPEVTSPITANADELRDKINAMLDESILSEPLLKDESNPKTIYKGFAIPGSKSSDAVWAIQKTSVSGNITVIKWAKGSKELDTIWDNRDSLQYS